MIADRPTASPQTGFQVLDYGESRRDLRFRTEVKYVLQDPDIGKLRRMLSAYCQPVSHNLRVSQVNSLYFDDVLLSACHANLNGLGEREKLRLRWYDTKLAPDTFFMEIKWRNNRVTGKHRYQMLSDTPLHRLSLPEIYWRMVKVVPPSQIRPVARYSDPVVVVQYHREHFVSPDATIRLTLDYDLRFFGQLGRRKLAMSFPTRLEGFAVVEGKTPIGREHELQSFLRPLGARADRCSKYVHGCRSLGYIKSGE